MTVPFTWIRGSGDLSLGAAQWTNGYVNKPDGASFMDPMTGKGQPPLTSTPLHPYPLLGGNLAAACPGNVCSPGDYFSVGINPITHSSVATGDPIIVNSNLSFSSSSGFGDYVFFGGLQIIKSTVNFGHWVSTPAHPAKLRHGELPGG